MPAAVGTDELREPGLSCWFGRSASSGLCGLVCGLTQSNQFNLID